MDTIKTTNYVDNLKPKKLVDYAAYLRHKKQMSLLREIYLFNNCSNEKDCSKKCSDSDINCKYNCSEKLRKCYNNLEILKYTLRKS